jgi:hypothetical protein
MRSALRTVDSRWAITSTVLSRISVANAACTCTSLSVSSDDVASSSTRIGASFTSARAIASRCRSPPESLAPRSPICVS